VSNNKGVGIFNAKLASPKLTINQEKYILFQPWRAVFEKIIRQSASNNLPNIIEDQPTSLPLHSEQRIKFESPVASESMMFSWLEKIIADSVLSRWKRQYQAWHMPEQVNLSIDMDKFYLGLKNNPLAIYPLTKLSAQVVVEPQQLRVINWQANFLKGSVSGKATIDSMLHVTGAQQVRHVEVVKLHDVLANAGMIQPKQGKLDLFFNYQLWLDPQLNIRKTSAFSGKFVVHNLIIPGVSLSPTALSTGSLFISNTDSADTKTKLKPSVFKKISGIFQYVQPMLKQKKIVIEVDQWAARGYGEFNVNTLGLNYYFDLGLLRQKYKLNQANKTSSSFDLERMLMQDILKPLPLVIGGTAISPMFRLKY
jgi:hypothetical protein